MKRPFSPCETAFRLKRKGHVIYSQLGNVLFPGWEYFVPKVGLQRHTLTSVKECLREINSSYCSSLISPVCLMGSLYLKASWVLYLSLDPSRHLSLFPPFLALLRYGAAKMDGRGNGMVMGEVTGGVKVATFLCLKVF